MYIENRPKVLQSPQAVMNGSNHLIKQPKKSNIVKTKYLSLPEDAMIGLSQLTH